MNVQEALRLQSLSTAKVVAGQKGLQRDVLWAHVIDMPDPVPWVRAGQFLLTTGFAWPTLEREVRSLVRMLNERGLAAVGLAVPGYVRKFADAARDEADRLNLPLVEIPFDVPFAQITQELHRAILTHHYAIMERSEQIHRALTLAAIRGGNLEDLARELGELLGRPVGFEDAGGKQLGYFSPGEDPQAWPDAKGADLGAQIRSATGAFRAHAASSAEGQARASVVCPIRLGNELVGVAWVGEGNTLLSELDFRAAEHAALVAALHIAHQRELSMTEARLGYASFLSLLEATDEDPAAVERARLLGFDPAARHRVGICTLPEPLPLGRDGFLRREKVAADLTKALRQAGTRPLLTVQLNRVIFLLPEGIDPQSLWTSLGDGDARIVLGRPNAGTDGLRRSYREAKALIGYADGQQVCRFEDALVPRVMMGDPGAREDFIEHIFGKLRQRKDGPTLQNAVVCLAKHAFSLKETADQLGVHQNTLRYRLGKALDVLRVDLGDPEARFSLQLAARLLDFSDKK